MPRRERRNDVSVEIRLTRWCRTGGTCPSSAKAATRIGIRNQRQTTNNFPRFSASGILILFATLIPVLFLFQRSSYGQALSSAGYSVGGSYVLLTWTIFVSAFLNVTTHAGVVLGALEDTLTISILIGVGFDVLTRFLQVWWWIRLVDGLTTLSSSKTSAATTEEEESFFVVDHLFHVSMSILFIYQMHIHIRALCIVNCRSYDHVHSVVTGALHNLRGISGENWSEDDWFAYSDLTLHLLPLLLSGKILLSILIESPIESNKVGRGSATTLLVLLGLSSWLAMSPSYSSSPPTTKSTENGTGDPSSTRSELKITVDSDRNSIQCSCDACTRRRQRTGSRACAFVCSPNDGLCAMWLLSFEDVSQLLNKDFRYAPHMQSRINPS